MNNQLLVKQAYSEVVLKENEFQKALANVDFKKESK